MSQCIAHGMLCRTLMGHCEGPDAPSAFVAEGDVSVALPTCAPLATFLFCIQDLQYFIQDTLASCGALHMVISSAQHALGCG
jgi:hypothetical protein